MNKGIVLHCARAFGIALLAILMTAPAQGIAAAPGTHEQGGYRYSIAPPAAWVKPESTPPVWPEQLSAAGGWRNWKVDHQVDLRGGYATYRDIEFEPMTRALLTRSAQQQIAFDPSYQKLVIHDISLLREGKTLDRMNPANVTMVRREQEFEALTYNGLVSFLIVLDDVRIHDRVRVAYTIEGANPILSGQLGEGFHLSWTDPVLLRTVRVLADPGTTLDARLHGESKPVAVVTHPDRVELQWRDVERAGIKDEGEYPKWHSPFPRLTLSVRRSWSDVATWAASLYPKPEPLSAELQTAVTAIRSKYPEKEQQLSALLRLVQDEVRYFGMELGASTHRPAEPNAVYLRRYGDCKDKSRLLVALLQALDIEAVPALVSAAHGKMIADEPPAATAFDHVIVQARIGTRDYWLDPTLTLQHGPPDTLSSLAYGVALPVKADSRDLIAIATDKSQPNSILIEEEFASNRDGELSLDVSIRFGSGLAELQRRIVAAAGEDESIDIWKNYYAHAYGEIERVGDAGFTDDESSNTLSLKARFVLRNAWHELDAGKRFLDMDAAAISQYLSLPTTMARTSPLAQAYPIELTQRSRVLLPDGVHSLANPGEATIEDKAFKYTRKVSVSGQTQILEHRFIGLGDHVAAVATKSHLDQLRKVIESGNYRLLVKFPQGIGEHREKRLQNLIEGLMNENAD